MDNEILSGIKPLEWKNVGPSIIHCSEVLIMKQKHNGQNFIHLQNLLSRFVKKVIDHMKKGEEDMFALKNKISRDLLGLDKTTENKMKLFKQQNDIEIKKLTNVIDEKLEEIDRKVYEINDKLSRVEDTTVVLDYVNKHIKQAQDDIQNNVDKLECTTQYSINRIERDELSVEGLFGPGFGAVEKKYKTMKDFVMDNLEAERGSHSALLKGLRSELDKSKQLTNQIMQYNEGALKKRLTKLTQLADQTTQNVNSLFSDTTAKDEQLL